MPGSRKKIITEKKKFPVWIPVAAALAAAGILLGLFWWPVPADEAYDLSLQTQDLVLTIEDGIAGSGQLAYQLTPKSSLLKARAKRSFAQTPLEWTSSDPLVAAVDANGLVTAVEEGEATLSGRFGNLSVSCPVTVYYPLKGLALSAEKLILQKAESAVLSVSPLPAQADLPEGVEFVSSDSRVAEVDAQGRVRALSVGEAVITARGDGFKASCPVTVLSAMTGIRIGEAPAEMNVGESVPLSLLYIPEDTTDDRTAVWESSDPAVVSVSPEGAVTALAPGTAVISVTVGPFREETEITVYAPLKGISLDAEELHLMKQESAQLSVLYDPENTTDDTTVTFSSADPGVATVDENGLVTAQEGGLTMITAQVGEHQAVCAVTVRVPMTGILIDGVNRTVKRGNTAQLTVSFSPADTNDDRTLEWVSDDPEVATVDEDGLVTAVGPGETLITASCGEFSDKVRITVVIPAEQVTISRDSLDLTKGEGAQLSAEVLPEDTTEGRDVSWSSSDSSVVRVDGNGYVTAVAPGSCTVRASHGSLLASCRVTVTAPMTGIGLNKTDITLLEGDSASLSVEYYPWDTTDDRSVSWSSSDSGVASVSGGSVRAVSAGSCTITATVGRFTASATVRVKPIIRVSSVSLSQTWISFNDWGQTVKLTASVSPGDATYPTVRWSSSDNSVASVTSDGTVRVSGSGSCTITATADGVSATCTVSASLPPPKVVIVLDPGHGPWSGATNNYCEEKDLNLATAKACREYLKKYPNIVVYLTRESDVGVYGYNSNIDLDLQARAAWAASKNADILVCMHYNANGAGGSMVFASVASKVKAASYSLGQKILKYIVALGFTDRGVLLKENDTGDGTNYYGILRYCAWYDIPAVLVEHCFMDNASDWANLDTKLMGEADAKGIVEYLKSAGYVID
jgi:uncharacterized protein YjdB